MTTPAGEYLTHLRDRGVQLWVVNGELRYRAEKGTLTPADLSQLRVLKNNLISELADAKNTRDSGVRLAPLSFQQQWLRYLMRQFPEWPCTLTFGFEVEGRLHRLRLQSALESLLLRHSALSSHVSELSVQHNGTLVAGRDYELLTQHATQGSLDEERACASELIRNFSCERIDPASGPPFRVCIIDTSHGFTFIAIVIHRLAADCLSAGRALHDFWCLYSDPHSDSSHPAVQYDDYSRWQEAGSISWNEIHGGYWNSRLAGAPSVRWPAQSITQSYGFGSIATHQESLSGELSAALRDLARRSHTLLGLILLSVYASVVSRWCAQRDFVIPFNIIGRNSKHEHAVGHFASPLYLRFMMTGSECEAETLQLVCNEFYRAVSHQDFGRMALQEPAPVRSTLFQWFSADPNDFSRLEEAGTSSEIRIRALRCHAAEGLTTLPPALVAFEMSFFETASGITASAIYRTESFAPDDVRVFFAQLLQCAARIAAS